MVFNFFQQWSAAYCYQCLNGPNGCLVPSRTLDGQTDLTAQFEELEAKLNALAKKRSIEIEKYLEDEKREEDGIIKILILGGPSSGKSTVFKQMQIIHRDGFKRPDELEYFKGLISSNIYDIYTQLIKGAKTLEISLESVQETTNCIDEIYDKMKSDLLTGVTTNKKLAEQLAILWKSEPIQLIISKRYDIELMDSSKYFFENILRIGESDYIPNEEDIVHSRRATTNIHNIVFTYTGLRLNMVDVGGQRSERRKWLHLFDDSRVILFVIDLTGYAKKSEESRFEIARFKLFKDWRNDAHTVSDMKVALKIFHEIATNRILKQAVFLMFFNKVDLFEELLPSVNLNTCFSKFTGENNLEETTNYIRDKFLRAAKPRKSVFPHFTTATNTENIKVVFCACMESVFKHRTNATGLA